MMGMVQVAASRAMVTGGLVTVHARHHHVREDRSGFALLFGDGIHRFLHDHLKPFRVRNFLHGILAFGGRIIHHEDLVDRHLFYSVAAGSVSCPPLRACAATALRRLSFREWLGGVFVRPDHASAGTIEQPVLDDSMITGVARSS